MNEWNDYLNSVLGFMPNTEYQMQINYSGMQNSNPYAQEEKFSSIKLRKLSDDLFEKLLQQDCLDDLMRSKTLFDLLDQEEKLKARNDFEIYIASFMVENKHRRFKIPDQQAEFDQWMKEKKEVSEISFEDWFNKNNTNKPKSSEEHLSKIKSYFTGMRLEQKRRILGI